MGRMLHLHEFRKVPLPWQSSPCGGHPFDGRSALDAVELMNVSANYMREHVKPDVRLHYATICSCAPNVVPDECSVWYYIRAPKRKDVDEVYSWLGRLRKGSCAHDADKV